MDKPIQDKYLQHSSSMIKKNNRIFAKLKSLHTKSSQARLLFIILLFASVLRLIWINSIVERDEGQFAYNAVVNFIPADASYRSEFFYDNKMPLLYLFYSAPIALFGHDILYVRMLNNILFIVSCYFFFKLALFIFRKEAEAYLALIIYILLMNIPAFEAQLAMSESFALPFTIIGLYCLTRYTEQKQTGDLMLSSLFFAVSSQFKVTFLIYVFFALCIGVINNKHREGSIRYLPLLFLSGVIAITLASNHAIIMRYLLHDIYASKESLLLLLMSASTFIMLAAIGAARLMQSRQTLILAGLIFSLFFSFFPNMYGHCFIISLPYIAISSASGLSLVFAIRRKTIALSVISLLLFSLGVNMYTWYRQYDDFTFNKLVNVGYSESTSREMQESIASTMKAYNKTVFVMGWEPYLCFRAEKTGCYSHYPYQHMNDRSYYNYDYLWDRFNNASLILFYADNEEKYIPYRQQIESLSGKGYIKVDFNGYYIYVK
ncbi:MAG: hypothetical protein HGA85_01575 [Nanoarchaeota archaeon]|nr:hypothetical protein [Nanoarchaeota archaeon]